MSKPFILAGLINFMITIFDTRGRGPTMGEKMDLQINIAKNGQHYFFVTVRNIYTEREIFEKLQETYPESEV